MRMLPDGASREAFTSLALSPHKSTNKRIWRWPNTFSFSSPSVLWKGRILPELEEQLESARIAGSSYLRTHPPANDDVDPGGGGKGKAGKRKKKEKERNRRPITGRGAEEPKQPPDNKQQEVVEKPDSANTYPLGKRLRFTEYESPKAHAPKDGVSGKPLCWNFNSNCGCGYKGKECEHGMHKLMRKAGIHWTVQVQLARRGGMKGSKILTAAEIDGFISSLREANAKNQADKTESPHTGGYCPDQ